MKALIQPVIMAGDPGTRLWALSRADFPKQFLVLQGHSSLLQQTVQRLMSLKGAAAPVVLGNEEHRFLILGHLRAARCIPGSAGRAARGRPGAGDHASRPGCRRPSRLDFGAEARRAGSRSGRGGHRRHHPRPA